MTTSAASIIRGAAVAGPLRCLGLPVHHCSGATRRVRWKSRYFPMMTRLLGKAPK